MSSLHGRTNSPIYAVAYSGGRRDIRSDHARLGDTDPAIVVASPQRTLRTLVHDRRGDRVLCVRGHCVKLLPRFQIGFGAFWALLGCSGWRFSSTISLIFRGRVRGFDGATSSLPAALVS